MESPTQRFWECVDLLFLFKSFLSLQDMKALCQVSKPLYKFFSPPLWNYITFDLKHMSGDIRLSDDFEILTKSVKYLEIKHAKDKHIDSKARAILTHISLMIPYFDNLAGFAMYGDIAMPADIIRQLKSAPSLQKLVLTAPSSTSRILSSNISEFRSLRILCVKLPQHFDAMEQLSYPKLTDVRVDFESISELRLDWLLHLPQLLKLRVMNAKFLEANRLRPLGRLRHLNIIRCSNLESIRPLVRGKTLTKLTLESMNTRFLFPMLDCSVNIRSLELLLVDEDWFPTSLITKLQRMSNLSRLYIDGIAKRPAEGTWGYMRINRAEWHGIVTSVPKLEHLAVRPVQPGDDAWRLFDLLYPPLTKLTRIRLLYWNHGLEVIKTFLFCHFRELLNATKHHDHIESQPALGEIILNGECFDIICTPGLTNTGSEEPQRVRLYSKYFF